MGSSDETPDSVGPRWWRFSEYEVRDGYLRPTNGARLETYDPRDDEAVRDDTVPSGYQSLTRLIEDLSPPKKTDGRLELARRDQDRVVAWAMAHGLLGILPHQVCAVMLPPKPRRRLKTEWWPAEYQCVRAPAGFVQHLPLEVVLRTQGRYRYRTIRTHPDDKLRVLAEIVQPERIVYRATLRQPRALVTSLDTGMIRSEPLGRTWRRFFPDAKGDVSLENFPVPLTTPFWRAYAEPLTDFLDAAILLRRAIDQLRSSEANIRSKGARALTALGAPAGLVLGEEDGELHQRWASPSLLAVFARQAIEKVTGGASPKICCVGGHLFLSAIRTQLYCSVRCRLRAQKRAYRESRAN